MTPGESDNQLFLWRFGLDVGKILLLAHQPVIQGCKYLPCELLRTHQGKAMLTQSALDDSFLLRQKLDQVRNPLGFLTIEVSRRIPEDQQNIFVSWFLLFLPVREGRDRTL